MPHKDTDDDDDDLLQVTEWSHDHLAAIRDTVKELAGRKPAPHVFNVAAPAVTMQTPAPGPVTVNVPASPKKWTVEIGARDSAGRIKTFTMTASNG